MSGAVVDLSKFASNNELNKWICQVLGLTDEARKHLDHTELVQALGYELIKRRVLLESIYDGLVKISEGLVTIDTSVAEFALGLLATIDNFELPTEAMPEAGA